MTTLPELLSLAYNARLAFMDQQHTSAFRLFNGFLEGYPDLSLDIYGRSALLHNYAAAPTREHVALALNWIKEQLPWVTCVICKTRNGDDNEKRGQLLLGSIPDRKLRENGVWYALDLTMHRDASFYLDTRGLRAWAQSSLAGKTVLNTFAYTGSLGVAALAGGAARVVQLDRNSNFLNLAKTSCTLNGFPINKKDFLPADFFPAVSQLRRAGQAFDCVFLDPPFFASTSKGTVDLETGSTRLINKLRPLVNHGGWLVAINNALFVSGADYLASLEALCGEYLSIEQLIPVPQDFTGFPSTRVTNPPVDPAPFNHTTKIVILKVRKKS